MRGTLLGIVGPTATGKTAVGIRIAKQLNGEIISADSMAVYRGMDIGTAKPNWEEQGIARFHLIDVVNPDEEFSVADFTRVAEEAIEDILNRGKLPIVVGGTGLYIRALRGGINIPVAAPDWGLRELLKAEALEFGGQHLLDKLREIDPITAERLHPNDINRIVRAIEVHTLTGKPISHYHSTIGTREVDHDIKLYGLTMERETLYRNIERRIDQQISDGLIEEVSSLLDKGYSSELPSMRGLGYKQIAGYLLGEYDLPTAMYLFKRDTRRFAKRQFTWFRAEPGINWVKIDGRNADDVAVEIENSLHNSA